MIIELENKELPRYLQVYNYYKELILSEKMPEETKLPSIRKGALELQMSRTTVESAYLLLAAEGYIISRPQSGYYVTGIAKKQKETYHQQLRRKKTKEKEILFDFVSVGVDKDSFHFELWRRYMKSALRQDERLSSYGEPQGELEFREVLCKYLRQKRGVICSPEQIVVGAGVQSLLNILCPLLKERRKVGFPDRKYKQGIIVFEDYGFLVSEGDKMPPDGVYYVTPSQMAKSGEVMSVQERLQLITEAVEKNVLLIEDDYNHEFRYFQKPTPSMQGLAGGKDIVYIGSFSKILLPSIRMSFMVLTPEIQEIYEKKKNFYNQTASKAEQIALTQFIRDGHLEGQIRKSRKIHLAKAKELAGAAQKVWEHQCSVQVEESGFYVSIEFGCRCSLEVLCDRARQERIGIIPVEDSQGKVKISMSTANVSAMEYQEVLKKIKELSEAP